jgi:hypothetical protein
VKSAAYKQIPYLQEQGIFLSGAGNFIGGAGNWPRAPVLVERAPGYSEGDTARSSGQMSICN